MMVDDVNLVGVSDFPGSEEGKPGSPPRLDDLTVILGQVWLPDQFIQVSQGQEGVGKVRKFYRDSELLYIIQDLRRIFFTV